MAGVQGGRAVAVGAALTNIGGIHQFARPPHGFQMAFFAAGGECAFQRGMLVEMILQHFSCPSGLRTLRLRCRWRPVLPRRTGMIGRSMSGSISFGIALVAGRKRVPLPAAAITARVIGASAAGLASVKSTPRQGLLATGLFSGKLDRIARYGGRGVGAADDGRAGRAGRRNGNGNGIASAAGQVVRGSSGRACGARHRARHRTGTRPRAGTIAAPKSPPSGWSKWAIG